MHLNHDTERASSRRIIGIDQLWQFEEIQRIPLGLRATDVEAHSASYCKYSTRSQREQRLFANSYVFLRLDCLLNLLSSTPLLLGVLRHADWHGRSEATPGTVFYDKQSSEWLSFKDLWRQPSDPRRLCRCRDVIHRSTNQNSSSYAKAGVRSTEDYSYFMV
jgi:hypothetical protein